MVNPAVHTLPFPCRSVEQRRSNDLVSGDQLDCVDRIQISTGSGKAPALEAEGDRGQSRERVVCWFVCLSGILSRTDFSFYGAARCRFSRRSNCAFAATRMVERLIATAPTLMGRSSPHRTRTPPATGMATRL